MEKIGNKRRHPPPDDDEDDDSRRPPESQLPSFTWHPLVHSIFRALLTLPQFVSFSRQRKVRFPKGKKFKETFTYKGDEEDGSIKPDKAAEQRAKRRKHDRRVEIGEEEVQVDISKAEIRYEVNITWNHSFISIYLSMSSLAVLMS